MGAKQQGANATEGRWLVIPRTLCFVFHGDDVLLMKRAAHRRVFPNQYNGLGGHIERDEDPASSARREIKEESDLDVTQLQLRAIHNINTDAATGIMLFVFTAIATSRDFVADTNEGTLHWIPISTLDQYDNLVEDLPVLLNRLLEEPDRLFFADVHYDDNDTIQITFAQD